jgi:hypothetical protein
MTCGINEARASRFKNRAQAASSKSGFRMFHDPPVDEKHIKEMFA